MNNFLQLWSFQRGMDEAFLFQINSCSVCVCASLSWKLLIIALKMFIMILSKMLMMGLRLTTLILLLLTALVALNFRCIFEARYFFTFGFVHLLALLFFYLWFLILLAKTNELLLVVFIKVNVNFVLIKLLFFWWRWFLVRQQMLTKEELIR